MRFHASSVFTNTDLGRSGNGTNPLALRKLAHAIYRDFLRFKN